MVGEGGDVLGMRFVRAGKSLAWNGDGDHQGLDAEWNGDVPERGPVYCGGFDVTDNACVRDDVETVERLLENRPRVGRSFVLGQPREVECVGGSGDF
jgi:hypothetical protein